MELINDKRFKDFQEGETLWIFYNENYKEDLDKFHAKYSILPITIESNKEIIRERSSGGYWEDSINIIEKCYYIKFHFLGFTYERYYDNYYDDKNQMTITTNIWEDGPILELFNNEESAKQYFGEFSNKFLSRLNIEIKQREDQIKLLKESIKEYE